MARHLLFTVRFHGDGQGTARFHGMTQGGQEWPPSPARLFQALVAGVARGGALPESAIPALKWLETLPFPTLAVPARRKGQEVSLFVPNNDADSLSDPRDVSGIRTKKVIHPSLFSEDSEFLYAWSFSDGETYADLLMSVARELYQLGRGVDPAWADAEVLETEELELRLERYSGVVLEPQAGGVGEHTLACPVEGTLSSLIRRHSAIRLQTEGSGRKSRVFFSNAPKAVFLNVGYGRVVRRMMFELRNRESGELWSWKQSEAVKLVEILRDAAAARLRAAIPEYAEQIESVLVGRKVNPAPITERVRLIPLPSIGSRHADRGIRRFVLEIPGGVPIPAEDLEWAFFGLEWDESAVGRPSPFVTARSEDEGMLHKHYLPSRSLWRSVTPVVLPEIAKRRRIDPARRQAEAKNASERVAEETRAVSAVHQALRHAGVLGIAMSVRVQREPFEAKGKRVEEFAEGTRFSKERLWHVEITFDRPVPGPLVIGDGRFLGLGLMAPVTTISEAHSFSIQEGLEPAANLSDVTQALRRAVMARVQAQIGDRRKLDPFFTGHQFDGAPLKGETKRHLAFAIDFERSRLLIVPPHLLEGRRPTPQERGHFKTLEAAVTGLQDLRAGAAGRLRLSHRVVSLETDPLCVPSKNWESVTDYEPTRFAKRVSSEDAIRQDIRLELQRRKMPQPTEIEVLNVQEGPRGGLRAKVRLRFEAALKGPLLLGKTCHLGGGLFAPIPP